MTGSDSSGASTPSWVGEGYFGMNSKASSEQQRGTPTSAIPGASSFNFRSRHGSNEVISHRSPVSACGKAKKKGRQTSSITPRTPDDIWEDRHEGDARLKASSFKLWLMSTLNRVLVLYHSEKCAEALPIIDHAFQRANEFGETSMFPRTALWRAIILDEMNQTSEVPKMLAFALALDICRHIGSSDPDKARLLEMLTKYWVRVDTWSEDAKKDGTAPHLIPVHLVSVYIKDLEADIEQKPRLGSSSAGVKKWVLHQRGESASQSSLGQKTSNVSDAALMIPPTASEAHQQILQSIAERKALKDALYKARSNSTSQEEMSLGRDMIDQQSLSSAKTDGSLYQDLMAKVKIPKLQSPMDSPRVQDLPLRQSQSESPPFTGPMIDFLDNLKRGRDKQRKLHAAPNSRDMMNLDKSKKPAVEERHLLTSSRMRDAPPEGVIRTNLRKLSDSASQHEPEPAVASVFSQHASSEGRKVTLSASQDAVLTDTPGGSKLEGLIERRKSIEERRRSLPSIKTNISNYDLQPSMRYSTSPTSDRRFSVDQSVPPVQSPLRRSSLVSDLDDGVDEEAPSKL